jgi:Leucine-rich repeat (LRR) protein
MDKQTVIQLKSGEEFIYPTVMDINPEYYDDIISLKCHYQNISMLPYLKNLEILNCSNNNLEYIPFYPKLKELACISNNIVELENYPLLEKLWCSKNKLTRIGDYPLLNILYCGRNEISEIGNCPSLELIDCRFNKMVELDNYRLLRALSCQANELIKLKDYPLLQFLCASTNKITELGDYPLIQKINCSNNLITRIPEYRTLSELDCSNNLITSLPNILEWRYLQSIEYRGNEIDYIPPNVVRFINRLNRNMKNKHNLAVFNDSQNVHNHQIQESIRESIQKVINKKPNIDFDTMIKEIINSSLKKETKDILIEFCDDKEIHSVLEITFKELLLSVWSIIQSKNKEIKDTILEILDSEMNDSVCKCFTGRMSRMINCLSGFDEKVSIKMSNNDQIGNIIVIIRKKMEKENETENGTETDIEIDIEKFKELVKIELTERGFSSDIIKEWVDNIE